MAYITKNEFIDKYLIKSGADLLSSQVLNLPHRVLSNNMDEIYPLIDKIALMIGESYETNRLDDSLPYYTSLGVKTRYVKDGMSFKEAIITLDRTAKNLLNFILSQTAQLNSTTPFIITGDYPPIIPGHGLTSNNWYIIPTSVLRPNAEGPILVRTALIPPLVFKTNVTPNHLIGLHAARDGDNAVCFLYQSWNGGNTWEKISGSIHNMWGWYYNQETTGAYCRADGNMDIAYGRGYDTNKFTGYAGYNDVLNTWTIVSHLYSNNVHHRGMQIIKANPNTGACIFIKYDTKAERSYFKVLENNFSDYGGAEIADLLPIVNPDTEAYDWYRIYGQTAIQLSNGTIVGVISGKTTSGANSKLYKFTSTDGGATISVPEEIVLSSTANYIQPFIYQLSNGGVVLLFTTDEDADSGVAPDRVKLAISIDGGETWKNKVTIYEFPKKYAAGQLYSSYSKLIEMPNGDLFAFIEEYVTNADRRLVRVSLSIEV